MYSIYLSFNSFIPGITNPNFESKIYILSQYSKLQHHSQLTDITLCTVCTQIYFGPHNNSTSTLRCIVQYQCNLLLQYNIFCVEIYVFFGLHSHQLIQQYQIEHMHVLSDLTEFCKINIHVRSNTKLACNVEINQYSITSKSVTTATFTCKRRTLVHIHFLMTNDFIRVSVYKSNQYSIK